MSEAGALRSVLFACTRNTIRSPMAAALLKARLAETDGRPLFVDSAGVEGGEEPDGFAVAAMAERGIDITGHHPKTFVAAPASAFDLVVALSPEAHHAALEQVRGTATEVEFWPIDDPTLAGGAREARLDAFRAVREALAARIAARF